MLELALDRIVFHLVGEVVGVSRNIDDGNDIDFFAEQTLVANRLENHAADTAKTIDTNFDSHVCSS